MKHPILTLMVLFLCATLLAKDRDRNKNTTPTLTEKALSAGFNHTLVIQEGEVFAWGENTYGQLGDGTSAPTGSSVLAIGLDHIIAVSAGRRHSLALRADGTVFAWGDNTYSQLGSVGSGSAIPVPVPGVSDIIDIQAGDFHCLALKSDGTVISWGTNALGELGRGFTSTSETPGNVIDASGTGNLKGITLISAGARHSLAILDGEVLAWGDNLNTQLGQSASVTVNSTPDFVMKGKFFTITRLDNIVSLSAGETHSLAIDTEGKLFSWGEGVFGQLGIGGPIDPLDPGTFRRRRAKEVASRVRTMAAGYNHSVFVDSQGELHFFGANFHGQFGIPLTTTRVEADSTVGYNKVVALACGTDFTLLLKSDGTIEGAGDNAHEQIGGGAGGSIPVFQPFFNKVDRLAQIATQGNSFVLKSDGSVWAFGQKEYVGFGTGSDVATATQIPSLTDIIAIGGTLHNAFALRVDGQVYAWGENESGACGQGTTTALYTSPTLIPGLSDIIYVSGSVQGDFGCCIVAKSHASAIDVNGELYMWGQNDNYELGTGATTRALSPTKVTAAGKVFSTSLARHNTFALYADNTVKAWGRRDNSGTTASPFGPTYVTTPTGVVTTAKIKAMSADRDARLALTPEGQVLVWGTVNYFSYPGFFDICQLGPGRTGVRVPTLIFEDDVNPILMSNVKFVTVGDSFAALIKADGSAWTWGRNNFGQLGKGYTSSSDAIPQNITCSTSGYPTAMFTALSGEEHVLANEASIAIKSWAFNNKGQVGPGYVSPPSSPRVLFCVVAARVASSDPVAPMETPAEQVLIYPNPTHETLHIQLTTEITEQATELRVIDMNGKTILLRKEITPKMTLQVDQLGTGLYILQVGSLRRSILIKD